MIVTQGRMSASKFVAGDIAPAGSCCPLSGGFGAGLAGGRPAVGAGGRC